MKQLLKLDERNIEDFDEQDTLQFLTFNLSQELYAIEILYIKEIIEYGRITTVPMMPDFIKGVINLRGQVVPVIDLKLRFDLGKTEIGKKTGIIIVDVNVNDTSYDIGVIVDSVSEVLSIAPVDLDNAPPFGTKIRSEFIRYMGKVNKEFVVILAIDKVLSIGEMATMNGVDIREHKYS